MGCGFRGCRGVIPAEADWRAPAYAWLLSFALPPEMPQGSDESRSPPAKSAASTLPVSENFHHIFDRSGVACREEFDDLPQRRPLTGKGETPQRLFHGEPLRILVLRPPHHVARFADEGREDDRRLAGGLKAGEYCRGRIEIRRGTQTEGDEIREFREADH